MLIVAGLLVAGPARAGSDPSTGSGGGSNVVVASGAGDSAAAAICSIFYAPLKVAYAAGGSIVAGLGYVVSGGDKQVVDPILNAAVRGDYWLTPEQIRGERPIEFVGRSPENQALRDSAADTSGVGSEPPASNQADSKASTGWN
jgi:hypothetical protein